MTTQITIATLATAAHAIIVSTTFGEPVKINPGETQVFDIYPDHTITAITEGEAIAAKEGDVDVQLSDQQKEDVAKLLAIYPDMIVGVGVSEGLYKIVDNAGNVFAAGTVEELVESGSFKTGTTDAPADDAPAAPADETAAEPEKEETLELTDEQKQQIADLEELFEGKAVTLSEDGAEYVVSDVSENDSVEIARGSYEDLFAKAD